MKFFPRSALLTIVTATLGLVAPSRTMADLYFVHRAWSNATLTGTLELPAGNYTIMNQSPAPFTAVNLTLSVNGSQIALFTNASTELIKGTGQFFINATPTTLTFSTANGNGTNPADLEFLNNTQVPRYTIGTDGAPTGFQVAFYSGGSPLGSVTFPTVFGILIPEPCTVTLGAVGVATLMITRRRSQRTDLKAGNLTTGTFKQGTATRFFVVTHLPGSYRKELMEKSVAAFLIALVFAPAARARRNGTR